MLDFPMSWLPELLLSSDCSQRADLAAPGRMPSGSFEPDTSIIYWTTFYDIDNNDVKKENTGICKQNNIFFNVKSEGAVCL